MFFGLDEQQVQEKEEEDSNDEFDELVSQCVQYANDLYKGEIQDQQKASDFFYQWLEHPKAFIISLRILNEFEDLYSNYAALTVFKNIISKNWADCEKENKEELKRILFKFLSSERDHSIINMCSILLSKIAIIEFPEIWEDFLSDTLRMGNSLVLIYYLEDLENNTEIPQNRRIAAHQVFISSFDDINNSIFGRFDMSAGSIRLYSLISYWTPLKNIINEKAIELLTTVLMESENTRENAIECLDIIFVQRLDCKEEFPRIHNLLLTNLYAESKDYPECAVLLAKILCAHLDFFGIESEYVEKVSKSVEPTTSEINEDGEEVLVFNLCLPKYEEIEIKRKKYLNYEEFNHCFLLLSSPGWCNTTTKELLRKRAEEEKDGNEEEEEESKNEKEENNDSNDDNDRTSDDDDDSNLHGPELYWSTWNKFLTFANNLECEKEDNYILNSIPLIFNNMCNFILSVPDRNKMINSDAQSCYLTIIGNDPEFVISQLESQDNSIDLLYVSCCCLKGMDFEYANDFIDRFFVPDDDPITLSHIIRCMSFLLRCLPEKEALIQFYTDTLAFSIDITPPNEELEMSCVTSLMFLSAFIPQVFYFNENALLKILCSLISNIEINPLFDNDTNHSLFIIAARVISDIPSEEISISCIQEVVKNITSFVYEKQESIINADQDEFMVFSTCISTITDFSQQCFRLAEVEGDNLLQTAQIIISSKSTKDRDIDLISLCFDLSASIISYKANWPLAEADAQKILQTALEGEKSQFGLALQFLSKIHIRFPESNSIFPLIYENIVQHLMFQIVDDSKYVLNYLLTAQFWNFPFALPIGFMKAAIKEFPHVCARPSLIITKEYCSNFQLPYIETFLSDEGESVFSFLIEILINSMFNVYFSEIVTCFMALFLAIYHLGFDQEVIGTSMMKVLDETFPNMKSNEFTEEDFVEGEGLDEGEGFDEGEDFEKQRAYKKKLFILNKFLHSCMANYMDPQKMEEELRELVVASHCCLPTISNLFNYMQTKNSNGDDKPSEEEQDSEQEGSDQEDEIDTLFKDITDADFDL